MKYFIRDFQEIDLPEITNLYIEGYSEQPWSEFKKCKQCGINYGKDEIREIEYYTGYYRQKNNYLSIINEKGEKLSKCKKCDSSMEPEVFGGCKPLFLTSRNLVDFWTKEDVINDLRFCQSQKYPTIPVAENTEIDSEFNETCEVVGFCYGYKLPFQKFPFLKGKVNDKSGYVDEIVVRNDFRRRGIGGNMLQRALESFDENQMKQAIVRTLTTSNAYPLFRKLDFKVIGRVDKNDMYENRVYLAKDL